MSLPVTSSQVENRVCMFCLNMREACWQGWCNGSKIEVSEAVESEKTRNSLMCGFPSIVSRTSLEVCARAIISVSWLDALLARGTLCWKMTRPMWMPVMAQPAALSVFNPSVKMASVERARSARLTDRSTSQSDESGSRLPLI